MKQEKNELFRAFHHELRHMLRTHHAICERSVGSLGIHPAQHMLLMHLAKASKIPSQKELALHMHISPAALAVSLGKLESAGYIEKSTAKDDSRINEIRITESGREVVSTSCLLFDDIDAHMFEGIDPQALQVFIAALGQMHKNLLKFKEGEISLCDATENT